MTHLLSAQPTPGSPASRLPAGILSAGRFVLHFVEMLLAMYAGMLLPWAVALGAAQFLPWLNGAADPAMLVGMLGVMLVRRDHYAHTGVHQHGAAHADSRPAVRLPWRRVGLGVAYLSAIVLVPLVLGTANLGVKMASPRESLAPPAYSATLPAPPVPDPSKKIAVVLAGFRGAEIGDTLEAYEILARSGVFNVYSVAPERKVLPLGTGPTPWGNSVDFAPQFSFAEYDSQIGRQPDLIAIPFFQADPTSARDAVIFDWIRGHFGPNTTILGICAGNTVLADTGLVAGRTATSNNGTFDYVESHSPTTRWLRNLRYVDDGNIVTSSNLTAGIDATLHVVDRFAGRATALDVAGEIGYTQTGALDDPRFVPPTDGLVSDLLPRILTAAFQGPEQRVGVLMYDGVTELGVSGIEDPFEGSLSARTFFMAPQHGIVRSRDGFLFVPRYDLSSVPSVDRVVAAAGDNGAAKQEALAAWSTVRSAPAVEDIYRNVGNDETAYDASLRDLSQTRGGNVARSIDRTLFYPAVPEDFSEASWLAPDVIAVLAFAAIGATLVFGATHLKRPRRVRLDPMSQPA